MTPAPATQVFQLPDAYSFAAWLGSRLGAERMINLGGRGAEAFRAYRGRPGRGRRLVPSFQNCRKLYARDHWTDIDVGGLDHPAVSDELLSASVVICADAIDPVRPARWLHALSRLSSTALAAVVTVPSASLATEPTAAIEAFRGLLEAHGLRPTFVGLTVDDSRRLERNTVIAVLDHCPLEAGRSPPAGFRPLALMATYNDIDIAPQTVATLLDDGIDVHLRDNWSTDGTFEQLSELAGRRGGLTVRRFPDHGPSPHHDLEAMLRWKEGVAILHPGRWIISQDSDEVRCSPWPDITCRGGLYMAELMGFSAIDMTVCNFRPVHEGFTVGMDPQVEFSHFEFGRRATHFLQVKAWRQDRDRIDLIGSGGHDVLTEERRVFPYRFLLKHYPLRSPDQARRKVFADRKPRYSPQGRARGWHTQYDEWIPEDDFLWKAEDLIDFEDPGTRNRYLTEFISGIGIVG